MEKTLEKKFAVYETPFIEITSIEQARAEVAFLHKAYSLGLFNQMFYTDNSGGGFFQPVNSKFINKMLGEIVADAENGRLPSKYSIGLIVGFDGKKINTGISEER